MRKLQNGLSAVDTSPFTQTKFRFESEVQAWLNRGFEDEAFARAAFRSWALVNQETVQLLSMILDASEDDFRVWLRQLDDVAFSFSANSDNLTGEEIASIDALRELFAISLPFWGPAEWRSPRGIEATSPDRVREILALLRRLEVATVEPGLLENRSITSTARIEHVDADFDFDLEFLRLTAADMAMRSSIDELASESFQVDTADLRIEMIPLAAAWRVRLVSFGAEGTYDVRVLFASGAIASIRVELPEDDEVEGTMDVRISDGPPVRVRARRR